MNFDELSSITCPICCHNCHRELSLFFKLFGKCNLQCGKNLVEKKFSASFRDHDRHFDCNATFFYENAINLGRNGRILAEKEK